MRYTALKTNLAHKVSRSLLLLFGLGMLWVTKVPANAPIYAQTIPTNYQLNVSPASAFLKARPGQSTTHTLTLRNNSPFGTVVAIRMADFEPDGYTGIPQIKPTFSFPYVDNLAQLQQEMTIPAHTSKTVQIAMTVPENAPEREYPIVVLVESKYETEAGNTSIIPTVVSNLVVWASARDYVGQKLEVVSLQRPKVIDSFRPFTFTPLVKNLETSSAVASGSATIKNWRGQVLGEAEIFPDVILGAATRVLRAAEPEKMVLPSDPEAQFARKLKPAEFNFTQPLWLGPYTVEFTFIHPGKDGADSYTTTHKQTVIALPLSLLAILAALGLVLGGSWYYQNHRKSQSRVTVPKK